MAQPRAKKFDDKKFMWDGYCYENETEALEKKKSYEKENFETRLEKEDGKFYLYTRRVVSEVKVT